jgi:cytochrome c peroxidase
MVSLHQFEYEFDLATDMLTLRSLGTHQRSGFLVLLVCLAPCAAADQLGPGDVRTGYDRSDYRSQSTRLNPTTGARLPLAQLAEVPPLGLPDVDKLDERAIALGRRLFFDRRLSANATLSCGMCHIPEQGFAQNEMATPVGIEGRAVRRNAPALYNVAYQRTLFHDGRETQLSRQIWEPLLAANEMGNVSKEAVITRLEGLDDYAQAFAAAYPAGLTPQTLGMALAAYQSGLLSGASRFDQWYFNASQEAGETLGQQERLGFAVFTNKGCNSCHTIEDDQALFTNGSFYNTGIGYRRQQQAKQPISVQIAPGVFVKPSVPLEVDYLVDEGRFEVTASNADRWRYRTPGLRNVSLTAPYMHDGSIASLEEVIDYYDGGGAQAPNQDPRIRPLALTDPEKAALVAFLRALTGSNVEALTGDARSVTIGDVN